MAKGTKQQDSIQIEILAEKQQRALEEEERKKQERERVRALYYFTAAYLDRVEMKKTAAALRRIDSCNFFNALEKPAKQGVLSTCMLGIKYAEVRRKMVENKRKFFVEELGENHAEEVRKTLSGTDFSEDHFATIAMCAADKHMKRCSDAILEKPIPPEEEEQLKSIRMDSAERALEAIRNYQGGNLKGVAKLIKNGLEHSCKGFANAQNEEEMIEYSNMAAEIMFVIEQHPMLIKACDLKPHQLEIAKKTAELGDELRKGLMAVEVLIAAEQKDTIELTEKQRNDMLDLSMKTKKALFERQSMAKDWDKPKLEKAPDIETPVLSMNKPII